MKDVEQSGSSLSKPHWHLPGLKQNYKYNEAVLWPRFELGTSRTHNSVGATASTEVLVIQPSPGEILNEYFIVQVFTSVVVPRYNSG
jgi:hypothetical protein